MRKDMACRTGSHKGAGQFGCSACVAVELGCGRRKRVWSSEPQVVTIPNVQDLCGLSPINLVRLSNALSGRAADQYAATLFFHDSDAGHDVVAVY